MSQISIILVSIIAVLIISAFAILFLISSKKQRLNKALNMSLFLIRLPRDFFSQNLEGEKQKTEKDIISVMEQFFASLGSIKSSHLVLEIANPSLEEEISFYIAGPRKYEQTLEKEVHGFFPKAQIEKTEDYNIFNTQGFESAAYLKLKNKNILPIKTYQNLESDSLGRITTALSKLDKQGQGAAIQILIKPTDPKWEKAGASVVKNIQETGKLEKKTSYGKEFFDLFIEAVKPPKKQDPQKPKEPIKLSPLSEETIKKIEEKTGKTAFDTNIRLISSAETKEQSEHILDQLIEAFTQFNFPNFNQFKTIKVKKQKKKKLIYDFSFRNFNNKQTSILNTEELSSIFHFPMLSAQTPKLKYLKASQSASPANMPDHGIILGENNFRGQKTIIRLTEQDRQRHLYIIGQTGTGKTSLMQELVRQDIQEGRGIGLIDPHGDITETVLGYVPRERAEDVVLFSPGDMERPIGLNMLEYDSQNPEQKTFIVNELINIFDTLYDLKTTGGPMFEQYTRNALLLLMDDPNEPVTLIEVPRVLADKDYRARLLAKCRNMLVKNFWEKEAEQAGGEAALQNMVPYITSKFNIFINNDYVRSIIGQTKTSLNFRQIMDSQKILLVNLAKGKLGDINSSLLGLIIVGKILMTAFARADMPEEQRKSFYFYIDEFQNFTTPSIATILSEARKYKLNLTIAHQFIGQLSEEIKKAVFGNVGNMLCMRVGAEDSEFLVKQYEPEFSQNDLINVDNFNSFAKLQISGQTTPSFSMQHIKPQESNLEMAKQIKELSRLKYGRDISEVEKEILERMQN